MVKACISGQMAKSMTENSEMIVVLGLAFFIIQMVKDLKEHGKMGKSMEKDSMFGQQAQNTTVFTLMESKKNKATWIVQMCNQMT